MDGPNETSAAGRPQFGLRALLGLTTVCAALFAAFRWFGMGPRTSLFVAAIFSAALLAAIGLVTVLGRYAVYDDAASEENAETWDEE